jgi:hypothetical protein
VRLSQTGLYRLEHEFLRGGMNALAPRWGGRRRRRIPPAERALLADLCRGTNICRNYQLLHKGAGLPGPPVSRSSVYRMVKELSGQIAPKVRQRVIQRAPSGRHPKIRTALRVVA